MVQVMDHAKSYSGTPTRAAQDTVQMYHCIMSSLTTEAQARVAIRAQDYTLGEEVSGTCLLKVVISESSIDTRATARHIREKLGDLDTQMTLFDSDIGMFNGHVKALILALNARGEETMDLLPNLFKGYKKVADPVFVKYIEKKQDDYDDGDDVNSDNLMDAALLKWKTMVQEKTYKAPSEDSKKIIALEARVQVLSNKVSKTKPAPDKSKGDSKESPKGGKGGKGKKPKFKKEDPAWMTQAPKDGKTTRTVNGDEWIWCETHAAWGKHTKEACHKRLALSAKTAKGGKPKPKSDDDDAPALSLSKALIAIADKEVDSD
jgi:hypothetical protein